MGDILFRQRDVNATVAAHASEEPALNRLLQQGRDATYHSQANLEDTTPGNMRLTTSATDRPVAQRNVQPGPVKDTDGWLEFAKNEVTTSFQDQSGRTIQRQGVEISVPLQVPGDRIGASMTNTITDGDGRMIKQFKGNCSIKAQGGDLNCTGTWRDGNNRFIVKEAFNLSETSKVSNYYNQKGQLLGQLNTSISANDAGARAETVIR